MAWDAAPKLVWLLENVPGARERTRDNIDALTRGGTPVPELKVDGGAARNNLLCQFQADRWRRHGPGPEQQQERLPLGGGTLPFRLRSHFVRGGLQRV